MCIDYSVYHGTKNTLSVKALPVSDLRKIMSKPDKSTHAGCKFPQIDTSVILHVCQGGIIT